jgi:hypothetical protein
MLRNFGWKTNMNCAFFIDNFKGMSGRTYIINGDIKSLNWLSEKFRNLSLLIDNSSLKIGDGYPLESNSGVVNVVIDNNIDQPEFKSTKNKNHILLTNRDGITEISDKLDGMVGFGKACHNYFDIGSGDVSRIFITTREYTDALLAKMAQDGDRVG